MAGPQPGLLGPSLGPSLPEGLWCCPRLHHPSLSGFRKSRVKQACETLHVSPISERAMCAGLEDTLLRTAAPLAAKEALRAFFVHLFLQHFIEMIAVRRQTFLNAQKELLSGSSA